MGNELKWGHTGGSWFVAMAFNDMVRYEIGCSDIYSTYMPNEKVGYFDSLNEAKAAIQARHDQICLEIARPFGEKLIERLEALKVASVKKQDYEMGVQIRDVQTEFKQLFKIE